MEKTVPFLGLITIDRDLDFHVIRRAERTHFYDEESRKSVGWNCKMLIREKGPVPPYFRQFRYDFEGNYVGKPLRVCLPNRNQTLGVERE